MTVKLLTKQHLEFLSLKGGCGGSSVDTCQNATLLEITCHDSMIKHDMSDTVSIISMWGWQYFNLVSEVEDDTLLTLNAPIATKVVCFSRLLKCLKGLYGKQCGPRSDCSYRSSLFWVHAVRLFT